MNLILEKIEKSILIRSFILGIIIGALVVLIKWSGSLDSIDFQSINHFYTARKEVVNNDKITVWTIFDDDIDLSRWPWTWNKFSEIFKILKRYDANLGMVLEDIFSELGQITISKEQAKEKQETLLQSVQDPSNLAELFKMIRPDYNNELVEALSEYPNGLLSQKFIIPDDQTNPEKLIEQSQQKKERFFTHKKKAIEKMKKFGLPWDKPENLLQAIDINPIHPTLSDVIEFVGFNRIIPDEDGTIRKAATVVYYDGYIYFSQGILATAKFLGCPIQDIEVIPGQHLMFKTVKHPSIDSSTLSIPIDVKGMMYINWTGKKQLKHFNNYPFQLIKLFLARAMAKNIIQSADFDADAFPIFQQQFLEKVTQSGFLTPDQSEILLAEIISIWFVGTGVRNGADLLDVTTQLSDTFAGSGLELFNLSTFYQSIKLNRTLAMQYEETKQIPSMESHMEDFDIQNNLVLKSHLLANGLSEETIQKLGDNGFLKFHPDNSEEYNDRLYIVEYSDLKKDRYQSLLMEKFNLDSHQINKDLYTYCYESVMKNKKIFEEGFQQTTFFLKKNLIEEVSPLYFRAPMKLEIDGNIFEVSLYDLINQSVFIGLTATGLNALNPTPYDRRDMMAGLTPAIFNTITTRTFIQDFTWTEYFFIFIFSILILLFTFYLPFYFSFPLTIVLCAVHYFTTLHLFAAQGLIFPLVTPCLSIALAYIGANAYSYWEQQKERKKVRGMFSAMVSPEVLEIMEADPDKFNLQGEKVVASMFSSDVSGFTSISEGVTAQELALILNLYLTPMSNLVMTYGGYVEKYEGDAIKADFGMPLEDPDHAWKACYSALLQQEELVVVQRMLQLKYGVEISARMGVNTGAVNAGNMGSENKMQYCAIGEEVAMAEELEPSNKMWETWIATGPETLRMTGDKVETRLLDNVIYEHVTIPVYEVLGWKKDHFLKFWSSKPIPKLVIEGWEKIIPEKIIAYLDYYTGKAFGSNPFYSLMMECFRDLKQISIEYMMVNDECDIYDVNQRFLNLQNSLKEHQQEFDRSKLSPIDINELERLESDFNQSQEDWQKTLTQFLLELKKNSHLVLQLGTKINQSKIDGYNTSIDTLEKNCHCYLKRIRFPKDDDQVGKLLKEHLLKILPNPNQDLSEIQIQEKKKVIHEHTTKIKNAMQTFIQKAAPLANAYHEFISEHCLLSKEKREVCSIFAKGRELYLQQKWDEAIQHFQNGLSIVPDDGPCIKFTERCENFKKNPPKEGWNGDWIADW